MRWETDVLIIGGGAAGCYAAITVGKNGRYDAIVVDKANIKRSGCLAAGVNAINAYLDKDDNISDYVKYVKNEFQNIVREDLLYTIAERLEKVTKDLENMGLPFLKDESGKYIKRGKRSVKINGENIKPIISNKVREYKNIKVLEKVTIIDYIIKNNKVIGVVGIDSIKNDIVLIYAKAILCTTGGASGIYKPNSSGFSKHKMWYSPFNVGSGLAMGIRAGAEMTSFECRFIALRIKGTISPTGTIAQGIRATQINALGEEYLKKYVDKSTQTRLLATIIENKEGRGPCYLKTAGISIKEEKQLKLAYLNMAPAQVLKWFDNDINIKEENVEIEGTEPYIVGGHSSSGYWINKDRSTTIKGLYAAGDVAGGSPKKYVTGAMVEGEIAIESIVEYIDNRKIIKLDINEEEELRLLILNPLIRVKLYEYRTKEVEELMQKTMDEYAGGITSYYEYSDNRLMIAEKEIERLSRIIEDTKVETYKELINFYELKDRLLIARVLIRHMLERKETRFKAYGQNISHKGIRDDYEVFINSILRNNKIQIIKRKINKGDGYIEH